MRNFLKVIFVMLFGVTVQAADQGYDFLVCGFSSGIVFKIGQDNQVSWKCDNIPNVQDVWVLKNGNLLASCITGAKEISCSDNKIVWEYKQEKRPLETHSCQPLPNGNVLLCECGQARLVEVDRSGSIVKEIKLNTQLPGDVHGQFRMARYTKDGTYLVAFFKEGRVVELNGEGKELRSFSAKDRGYNSMHGCLRLNNGNTLTTTGYGGGVFEFDNAGEIVWSFEKEDFPEDLRKNGNCANYAAGIQQLPNGNRIISYYGANPQFVEVNPDKKVLWSYYNPDLKNIASQTRLDSKTDQVNVLR